MTFYDVLIFSDLRTQFLDSSYTDVHVKTQIAQIALKPVRIQPEELGNTHKVVFNARRMFGNGKLANNDIFLIFRRDSKSSRLDFFNT